MLDWPARWLKFGEVRSVIVRNAGPGLSRAARAAWFARPGSRLRGNRQYTSALPIRSLASGCLFSFVASDMSNPRRRFLGWLRSASLLGMAGTPSIAYAGPARGPEHRDARALPVAETWDMTLTARVAGKYKAVVVLRHMGFYLAMNDES